MSPQIPRVVLFIFVPARSSDKDAVLIFKRLRDCNSVGARYRVPFNTVASSANVATPDDKFVVTQNSETPYSFLWVDLRAEPVVVTRLKIEKNRYYTGRMIDL
jgi:hypothetical protein